MLYCVHYALLCISRENITILFIFQSCWAVDWRMNQEWRKMPFCVTSAQGTWNAWHRPGRKCIRTKMWILFRLVSSFFFFIGDELPNIVLKSILYDQNVFCSMEISKISCLEEMNCNIFPTHVTCANNSNVQFS